MKAYTLKLFFITIILVSSNFLYSQCTTSAGDMTSTTVVQLCSGDCTNGIVTHAGNQTLNADDILEFVLYKSSNPSQIIIRKSTPDFCFSEITAGQFGTTYIIAARAGNNIGGIVNPSDPCLDQSIGTPVVWFETPIAHISQSETSFCGLNGYLNASAPQAGMTGTWSSNVSFIPITGDINTSTIEILVANEGTHTFTWTINNGPCSSSANINLNFIPIPNAYAGQDSQICGNKYNLTGIQSVSGSTASWTGNGSFASSSSFETEVTGGLYGTVTFTLRESIGACWSEDNVNITFIQAPNPVIITPKDTVCGNTGSLNALNTVGSGSWSAIYNGTLLNPAPLYSNGQNSANTSVTIGAYPQNENSRTVIFRWIETTMYSGTTCKDSVDKQITFSRKPIASVGPVNMAEVCGHSYTLNADITGNTWATGRWISPNVTNPFDNPNIPNATITIPVPASYGDSAYFRAPFIWAMTNTGCVSIDTMWVSFYKPPHANAGIDRRVCGNTTILGAVYSIPETSNYQPSGKWSVAYRPNPNASANIASLESDTTNVTVSHVGIWRFQFRENNSNLTSCYSVDTVEVEFIETPIISAGENRDVCGQTTTMQGISGGHNGTWLPNGTSIADFTNPTTTVTSPTYGAINFVWLESNEFCSAKDTVVITFWSKPSSNILTDEADSTVCGLTYHNLRAENPGTGITGYWYNINPATTYGSAFAVNTYATVPYYGYHDFYWIEETGPGLTPGFCNDTAGPLRIHFIEIPRANAGGDTLFCGNSGYLNAIPSIGTGVWSTPSVNLIDIENQNDPNSYIESEIINTGHPTTPYFNLIWTEDNTNGCTDKDTIKVVFARIPKSTMKIVPPKCFGELATIAAAEDTLQQYTWNFYSGITDSATYNAMGGKFQNFVRWNGNDTIHRISLVAINSWGCQSPVTVDTVREPAIPKFDHKIVNDTCALGKGGIIFLDTVGSNAFFWIDPEYGPAPGTPITSVYNIPAGTYGIRTSYLSPNVTHYAYYISTFGTANCLDTIDYEIIPIGMIEAKIEVSADVIMEDLVAPKATVLFLNNSDYDNVGKRCEWHFDDGTTLKSCDPMIEHVYTKGGICYEPFLIVMNKDLPECRDTARLTNCIYVDEASKIEVPNIFSPNGDGINDFFQVKAQTLKSFNGIITNRWGTKVFEWTDWETYEAGWDGNIAGSSKAAPGVYFYVIKAEGYDGLTYELYGVLHLMRE